MFRRPTVGFLLAFCTLIAGASANEVSFALIDAKDGKPVGDAVVSLTPLGAVAEAAKPAAPGTAEIEQKNQQFLPFVTAVRTGTEVVFPNRDTVEHHAYSQSPARPFELPLYKPGRAERVLFDKPGIVSIGCNIHDWMLAYVVVLDTPWFAVTPAAGTAALPDVPPGRYHARVWHPRLRTPQEREITVGNGAVPLRFELALKPDQRIRRTLDGVRGGYR